jgi:hypothetical protein
VPCRRRRIEGHTARDPSCVNDHNKSTLLHHIYGALHLEVEKLIIEKWDWDIYGNEKPLDADVVLLLDEGLI